MSCWSLAIFVSMRITSATAAFASAGFMPGEREHAADVPDVEVAHLLHVPVVLQVVVAIGQADAVLVEARDHLRRVLEVLLRR